MGIDNLEYFSNGCSPISKVLLVSASLLLSLVAISCEGAKSKTERVMDNCIWRPNEATQYKIKKIVELEPFYMEDMAICGENIQDYKLATTKEEALRKSRLNKSNKKRRSEQEKWAWLKPKKKDLVILAELFGCLDEDDVRSTLVESGYGELEIKNPVNIKREQVIRNEFEISRNLGIRYTTILFRPVDQMWIKDNHSSEHHKDNIVWITTYYYYLEPTGENKIKLGSREYWIDCKNFKYQFLSDYWTQDFFGYTTPEHKCWKQIRPDNTDFVYRLYEGFCDCK